MMTLQKLPDKIIGYRLLVELKDLRTMTEIALPDGSQTDRTIGKVVMVGDGELPPNSRVRNLPLPAKIADVVLMADFGGGEIDIAGKPHRLISGDDVLAVIETSWPTYSLY